MKKKIFILMIALFMFIPIVKAADVTIDNIKEEMEQRITTGISFLIQEGKEISIRKVDDNNLRIWIIEPLENANALWEEVLEEDYPDNRLYTYLTLNYENGVLSYDGHFGYSNKYSDLIDYKTTTKDAAAESLMPQNKLIIKEALYTAYCLTKLRNDEAISSFLQSVGLENENGTLALPSEGFQGITITKESEDWFTGYSIDLNTIFFATGTLEETNPTAPQTSEIEENKEETKTSETVENPKTGTDKYIIPGSALLIGVLVIYAVYKKVEI